MISVSYIDAVPFRLANLDRMFHYVANASTYAIISLTRNPEYYYFHSKITIPTIIAVLVLTFICKILWCSLIMLCVFLAILKTTYYLVKAATVVVAPILSLLIFVFLILVILVLIRGGAPRFRMDQLNVYNFSTLLPAMVAFIIVFIIFSSML